MNFRQRNQKQEQLTSRLEVFLNKYPAKSLPTYTVIYGEDDNISNSNEVYINRRGGIKQNCRYLFSAQIDGMTSIVIEKCFADRHDVKECLYRCINVLPVKWIHIYYIKDNESLSYIGSYTAKNSVDKQFWFSEELAGASV